MDIDNEAKMNKNGVEQDLIFIRKALIQVLYDHELLSKTVSKFGNQKDKSFFSVYVKALVCIPY